MKAAGGSVSAGRLAKEEVVVNVYVGTSGYSYKEWKGSFYPQNLPDRMMLQYYSRILPAVELNTTFYRMPTEKLIASWAEQVPPGFRFVLKASRRITHIRPLRDKGEEVDYLCRTAGSLGEKLGAILFQLPPYLRRDMELLQSFMELLPRGIRAVFEFRHSSWCEEELHAALRHRGSALCCSDEGAEEFGRLVDTAGWGYLRLRRPSYTREELQAWLDGIRALALNEVYVFFKHEDEGAGPRLAREFLELVEVAGREGK